MDLRVNPEGREAGGNFSTIPTLDKLERLEIRSVKVFYNQKLVRI